MSDINNLWPKLSWKDWSETGKTLHLFAQIIGKIRLALMPKEAESQSTYEAGASLAGWSKQLEFKSGS